MRLKVIGYDEAGGEKLRPAHGSHSAQVFPPVVPLHWQTVNPSMLLSLQTKAGNKAVAAAMAARAPVQRKECCASCSAGKSCEAGKDPDIETATPAVALAVQRTIGDGHDLTSTRFAGNLKLEACYDDETRLRQGDTGDAVTPVQKALIELGYDLGPAGADGIYGQRTSNAVKAFKKNEHLGWEHMGDVGPGTIGRLNELFPGGGEIPPCPQDTDLSEAVALPPGNTAASPASLSFLIPGVGLCGHKPPGTSRRFELTFDDGPHVAALGAGKNLTEKVLDTLKSEGSLKAGFFIQTGVSFRGAHSTGKELVKRMADEGHTIGIHTGGTKDHELHTEAERAGRLESELKSAKKYIKDVTGKDAKLVRPPTGKFNKAVEDTYKKVSLTNLLWDIDGDEGADHSLSELKARFTAQVTPIAARGWTKTLKPGSVVVLYHDIQRGTANNLAAVIEHIRNTTKKLSGGADTADFQAP